MTKYWKITTPRHMDALQHLYKLSDDPRHANNAGVILIAADTKEDACNAVEIEEFVPTEQEAKA